MWSRSTWDSKEDRCPNSLGQKLHRNGFDSSPGAAGTKTEFVKCGSFRLEKNKMHAVNLELIYEHDLYKFNYILNGGGLDERSSEEGGSGCCGNIEAGMPPGNTGNTDGT